MSTGIQEEEQLGKAFDSKLMRRLVGYLTPYRWLAICAILMMLMATGSNLVRPYLVEVAIDDHMNALTQPMVVYSGTNLSGATSKATFHGNTYIRENLLSRAEVAHAATEAVLYETGSRWYLVQGTSSAFPLASNFHVSNTSQSAQVQMSHGTRLTVTPLTSSDVAVFRTQDVIGVVKLGALYLAAILLAFGLNFAQTYLMGYAVARSTVDLRTALFVHLQRLNLRFFDKNPVGRIVTRVMNDVQTVNDMLSTVLQSFFQDIFTIIGIIFVLIKLNVSLALIGFVAIPFIVISTAIYRRYARDAFRQVRVRLSKINASLAEYLSGMRIIHIFQQQRNIDKRFRETNGDYLKSSLRELLTFALYRPSMDFIYTFTVAILLWYGGKHVMSGTLQFGVLYAFISYVQQFFQPVNDLAEKYNVVQQAMASSERIFELLDNDDFIHASTQSTVAEISFGRVEFRNVWFAYIDEEWVLRDVSFTIEPGQTVAFVGATGAGKSSILNLMSRFYEIQKGEILVDGINILDWPIDQLRRRIGVVMQDVFLFSGTIADNIRLGETDITDEIIDQVVEYVNAKPFVSRLTDGVLHQVQERGVTFSSGERQLIAFARALAFNPPILVLDEATSNIDTETEQLIQDALVKLTTGRTTIVVAHRLSTIQHADNIIVLHKGKIREQGTHQALLSKRGMYFQLYQLQYKDQEVSADAVGESTLNVVQY